MCFTLMSCARCGSETCAGDCQPAEPAPLGKETATEAARRKRLERGDTLPDVEEEDEDDLDLDLDDFDEETKPR